MVELTMAMEQERDKLERSEAAVATCARCKEHLSAKDATAAAAGAPVNRSLGDGQYSVVSNLRRNRTANFPKGQF